MKYAVLAVLILSLVIGVVFWKYGSTIFNGNSGQEPVELVFWGLWDEESALKPIFDAFRQAHPNIKITYVKQATINYRSRLQTQLRGGQGPDVFRLHSSWLPMFISDLAPAPTSIENISDFALSYYPMVTDTLTVKGKIYALPAEIDGLVLYYNEDILKAANLTVPKTWPELIDVAKKVTVPNQQGQIQTAGLALGTTTNINYWAEILGLLFLQQPNADLLHPSNQAGLDVIKFYTDFMTNPRIKTWDSTLPDSRQMFSEGKLAFYFGLAKDIPFFRVNPSLNFKTMPVPKLPGGKDVAWGSFWADGVSVRSKHQEEAWQFVKFINSQQAMQYLHDQNWQQKTYSRIYPRKDMGDLLKNDPLFAAFISQAPNFKGWYLNSEVSDAALDDGITKLYQDAVESALKGSDPVGALSQAEQGIGEILAKYPLTPAR